MCRAIEDMWNRAVKEGNRETAQRMLAAGKYTLSEIADMTGLTLDEVKEIKAGKSA